MEMRRCLSGLMRYAIQHVSSMRAAKGFISWPSRRCTGEPIRARGPATISKSRILRLVRAWYLGSTVGTVPKNSAGRGDLLRDFQETPEAELRRFDELAHAHVASLRRDRREPAPSVRHDHFEPMQTSRKA